MTANPQPATPADSTSDPGPALAAVEPRLSEAEVQSLKAVIHDVSGEDPAAISYWELDTMAPFNAESTVRLIDPFLPIRELSAAGAPDSTSAPEPEAGSVHMTYPRPEKRPSASTSQEHRQLPQMLRKLTNPQAAIARLKAFTPPPFPLWDRLPVSRRAAVLILLYADRRGDLRVVLTMRAANLRSFSGHAAFPGGKADSADETPYQIARREAWEEIGLPMDDAAIPAPFQIEFLCHLPHNLARTSLAVRPCVALLHTPPPKQPASSPPPSVESMIPRLDPREVAAVFSAPFANFLSATDLNPSANLPPGHWYDGRWINWKTHPWRVHNFYVPVTNQRVAKPRHDTRKGEEGELADKLEEEEEVETGRYKVWGMTAKILVDVAAIAYGRRPEFEHNETAGDEALIEEWEADGEFFDKARAKQNGVEGKKDTGEPAKM